MANIDIYGTLHNVTGEPIARAEQIEDESLGKTQAELNALYDQGMNSQGVQIGKVYRAAPDGGLVLKGAAFALSEKTKEALSGAGQVGSLDGLDADIQAEPTYAALPQKTLVAAVNACYAKTKGTLEHINTALGTILNG